MSDEDADHLKVMARCLNGGILRNPRFCDYDTPDLARDALAVAWVAWARGFKP